jgi:hypothetical protein
MNKVPNPRRVSVAKRIDALVVVPRGENFCIRTLRDHRDSVKITSVEVLVLIDQKDIDAPTWLEFWV